MSDMRSFLLGLSTRAKVLFAVGLIAILSIMAVGGWWALRPDYVALAQNLRPADASEVGTALSGWSIPYRFGDGDKTVLVPADQVYSLRMKLAAEGIPKGGSIGFEAFKDSDYGVTEFAQQVNYQRALQGELERTIESMQEVQSARVHLAIHHAGLFEKDQSPSKGSVTLHLRPDAHLGARQVVGIQRLVASAVDGLQPGSVTVLDQDGTVLSGTGVLGDDTIQIGEQVDESAKLEQALRTQVSDMLTRALHRDDFTVSVAVQLNYDRVKRVQEHLLAQGKDGRGVVVHEKTDSSHASESQGTAGSQGGTPAVTSRDVEYAHGKVQEEIEQAPGHIQRISVGVVVPGTLTPSDIKQLSDVIAAGIGLDPSRGDRIDIAAMAPWTPPTQRTAADDAKSGVIRPVPSQPVAHRIPETAGIWLLPRWAYIVMGVMLLLGTLVGSRMRMRRPRRLTAAEREATLEQLVQWIKQPDHVS
jgi:flagellar M-ring protein FliF